ncbi:MAG: stage III sporulation protein AB [Intestinimonas sp.]|jgi:stage III sporulation protein AB|nr:stage III sporulation protein AB [Intestinimonas sp.]
MLKLLGAFLLALGASGLGFGAAAQLRARVRALRSLTGALAQMERELSFRLTPTPQLFSQLAQQAQPPADLFFARCRDGLSELGDKTLSEVWREALAEESDLLLEPRTWQIMESLGSVLGRFDAEQQQQAIRGCVEELRLCLHQTEADSTRLGRVYSTLGMGAGALMVILLL